MKRSRARPAGDIGISMWRDARRIQSMNEWLHRLFHVGLILVLGLVLSGIPGKMAVMI